METRKEPTMAISHMTCPGCSGRRLPVKGEVSVFTCAACGAIFGECYLGESYKFVLPQWSAEINAQGRYYDFICLGSQGITRRHGWFNPADRKILQTG
jgi:hypothetical protein